jgi:hypothetical protein
MVGTEERDNGYEQADLYDTEWNNLLLSDAEYRDATIYNDFRVGRYDSLSYTSLPVWLCA